MSWWDIANDPNESTGKRVLAGLGCGALPWVCISQEATQGAQRTGEAVSARVDELRADVAAERDGVLDDLRGVIETSGEAAERPLRAAGDLVMWGSVLLGILLLFALVGLFVWFVALPYLRGGPRGGPA